MRRRHALVLAVFTALMLGAPGALGQPYPTKPIRIIVGYPPGAQSDAIARLVGRKLGELLGQPVVIENRAGASGTIGANVAARSPADGYTLLLGAVSNLALVPALDINLQYDPLRDFALIGRFVRVPLVLAVGSHLPVTTVPQLLAYARMRPGQLTHASSAAIMQFAIEQLKATTGIDVVQVSYKGSAPALVDVAAGRVDFTLTDLSAARPFVQSGAVRLIATTGLKRARSAPDQPTMAEQGVPDFVWESWQAIAVPSGTPAEVISNLQAALKRVVSEPEVREGFDRLGFEPIDETPAESGVVLRKEMERFKRLAAQSGIRVEPY